MISIYIDAQGQITIKIPLTSLFQQIRIGDNCQKNCSRQVPEAPPLCGPWDIALAALCCVFLIVGVELVLMGIYVVGVPFVCIVLLFFAPCILLAVVKLLILCFNCIFFPFRMCC